MNEASIEYQPYDPSELRRSERADVHVEVDVFSDHNFWSGLTMNMSEGGLFVATHAAVPVGTSLMVSLTLPGEEEPLLVRGEVRWTRPYNPRSDAWPGLGIQFVDLDDAALAKVRWFVDQIREPLYFEN